MNDRVQALAVIAAWQPEAICEGLDLSETARACLADAPAAPEWLAALLQAGCHRDAVTFLAHALPRTHAVRWACDCAELAAAAGPGPTAAARIALGAARTWAMDPAPAHREDAARAAGQPGLDREGAARFAAFAAAWSGESLAPVGHPVVASAPGLGATAVAAAVTIAAIGGSAEDMRARLRDYIGRGMLHAVGVQ